MPVDPIPYPNEANFIRGWVRLMRDEGVTRLAYGGWEIHLEPRPVSSPQGAAQPLAGPPWPHTLPAPPPMVSKDALARSLAELDEDDDNDGDLPYDSAGPPRSRL